MNNVFFTGAQPGNEPATPAPNAQAQPTNDVFFAGTPKPVGPVTRVHHFPLPPEDGRFEPMLSHGQYVLPHPMTGAPSSYFTRATTTAKVLESTDGLDIWKMTNVVLGLKSRPDLLDDVDLFRDPIDVSRSARDVAYRASDEAGASEAAERGTAIHAWTEALELGNVTFDQVPIEFQETVRAYFNELHRFGISTVPGMIERIVFNPSSESVGTLDRIYQLADGSFAVGDIKTSKSLSYSWVSFAAQLATYATASHMLSVDGTAWEPMPEVRQDFAVLVHLPSNKPGGARIVTFDLSASVEALALSMQVKELQRTAGDRIPDVHQLPLPDPIIEQIKQTTEPEQLSALWSQHQAVWQESHTEFGMQHLRSLGYAV